jgi:Uma2 family endonuclease
MSTVLERAISNALTNGVKPCLVTVSEYDRMIEAGIYTENDRIELLNGEIIEIMPKGPKHSVLNDLIIDLFSKTFGEKVYVR